MLTFKVIGAFEGDSWLELCCPKCGREANVPTNGRPGCLIIARCGLGLVTDPPGHTPPSSFMPATIQCRKCRTVWTSKDSDVREAV